MLKKIVYTIIILNFIVLILCNSIFIYADDEIEEDLDGENLDKSIIEVSNRNSEEPNLNCRNAVVYDRTSGNIIFGKNENKRTAMASTTKIMTAIILIENADLSQIVSISAKSAGTGGSRLGLKKDDKITMNDLLYGLMLRSGNDAAVAIAENIGGSIQGFAELMNAKAKELGLENTQYVTPHGLDNPEHYTTAVELAKLTDYAMKNKIFSQVVGTKNYTITINGYPKNITNTNELLGYLNGVNGVKTGFTNNAGRCLVTSVNRDGFEIITVVLQADTKKFRTADSIKLIEYVYENYELLNIKDIVDKKFDEWCKINKNRIKINKGKNDKLNLYFSNMQNDVIPVKKSEKDNVDIEVNCLYYFEAPVKKNDKIGSLRVVLHGETIDVVDIKNKNEILKKDILDYLRIFAINVFEN